MLAAPGKIEGPTLRLVPLLPAAEPTHSALLAAYLGHGANDLLVRLGGRTAAAWHATDRAGRPVALATLLEHLPAPGTAGALPGGRLSVTWCTKSGRRPSRAAAELLLLLGDVAFRHAGLHTLDLELGPIASPAPRRPLLASEWPALRAALRSRTYPPPAAGT